MVATIWASCALDSSTEPGQAEGLEGVVGPSVPTTLVQAADTSVDTTVALTWPGPPTTNYESLDGFYNASETTATVLQQTDDTLPATGAASGPLLGIGLGAVVLGAAALWASRRKPRPRLA